MKRLTGILLFSVFFCLLYLVSPVCAADPTCQNTTRPLLFGLNKATDEPAVYAAIQEAGATYVGLAVNWDIAEPTRGAIDFSLFDSTLAQAEARNLGNTVMICCTPDWAKEGNLPPHKALPRRDAQADYEQFIRALATRHPQVNRYIFWNEQNGCGSNVDGCRNTEESVREYAYWLDVTYKTLKAINPQIQLSVGGLDGNDEGFMDVLHNSPGGRSYDVMTLHPYNWFGPANLDGVKHMYEKYHKPIWMTEYGWNVAQGYEHSISENEAADYLRQTFDRLLSNEFSFVEIASFHTVMDFADTLRMGLIDATGRKRPTYTVFHDYATRYCPQPLPTPIPTPVPTPFPTPTPSPSPIPLLGDLNKDNQVDIFDYNLDYQYYMQQNCAYNQIGDCVINADDLATIVANFDVRI
ncbi:MAG: cellulase family glycosylhydrolase [Candidatus Pacebacteria bacterium]|nr:cellulase family glycosylhydrolase [Candidatus Paceibacterota bacterium]PIR61229.1 MAG: hypothetical protein COU68_00500 [Candidatus Pacebacteria bacterium CG10_big_fil_rev_8_21_14_0_10_45_6]